MFHSHIYFPQKFSSLQKLTKNLESTFYKELNKYAKLYIPSTINIWKKVLTKGIWADKKWAGFWQISLYIK